MGAMRYMWFDHVVRHEHVRFVYVVCVCVCVCVCLHKSARRCDMQIKNVEVWWVFCACGA